MIRLFRRLMLAQRDGQRVNCAHRLPRPTGTVPSRIDWLTASTVLFYHGVALLAFLPWFFSWTGVVIMVLGHYVFGALGISLCFHRLLTHRGFVCPKWLEHMFAILGVCCVQDTPARWVAVHRRHHEHADDPADPHSPLVSFLWGHMGWLFVQNRELGRLGIFERYAKDILRDPFYRTLERRYVYLFINLLSWAAFFFGGVAAELLLGGTLVAAAQFGASLLIWGVFVRTATHMHATWAVNSVTHRWGYRSYDTDEGSRNNLLVGIIAHGEGWHNNHHADPRSARHGHRWWELDTTWIAIRVLAALGLATNISLPQHPSSIE